VVVSAAPAGASAALARHLGRFVITDDPAHPQGPLAGVAAGLAWAKDEGFDLLYTLPCDTPLVTPRHLAVLARVIFGTQAAYAATPGLAQPLCALWSVDVAEALRAHLDAGRHPPVRVFLAEIGARAAPFAEGGAFRNVNTLADLAGLQAELGPRR
jgi:molybdopterin-guanine dinucleotide biosynthesis protein A